MLDAVASSVYLKVPYHNDSRKQIILEAGLRIARRVHDDILKNIFTTTTMLEEPLKGVNMDDLDV